jgi:uncharacterized membrane-anchored protein
MGDLLAGDLRLGHAFGLPFLAAALMIVIIAERLDRFVHQSYYWLAIVIVRTAATNVADLATVELKLLRSWIIVALTLLLVLTVWLFSQFVWRSAKKAATVLYADSGYWACMFIAGTLGTVIGDFWSQRLNYSGAAILLSSGVAALFITGRGERLLTLRFYWLTVVAIRAAGTAIGDFLSSRYMLGLAASTAATGLLLVALLAIWKEPAMSKQPRS